MLSLLLFLWFGLWLFGPAKQLTTCPREAAAAASARRRSFFFFACRILLF